MQSDLWDAFSAEMLNWLANVCILTQKSGRSLFQIFFYSRLLKVYLEYIIYDFVATISAIGGTLGLCIGFSFTGVASILLEHAALLKKKIGTQWNVLELEVGEWWNCHLHGIAMII